MATFQTQSTVGPGGVSRRQILKAGAAAAAGAALCGGTSAASEAAAAGRFTCGKAKHVIHIYLHGGAPTQDMWDLKPTPGRDPRQFKPIATSASGIQMSTAEDGPVDEQGRHRPLGPSQGRVPQLPAELHRQRTAGRY
jgi:hypothetical protein